MGLVSNGYDLVIIKIIFGCIFYIYASPTSFQTLHESKDGRGNRLKENLKSVRSLQRLSGGKIDRNRDGSEKKRARES
jgi:hypothetical protein